MYSDKNNDSEILQRMLDNVPSDIYKSEGSFIYDALSPTSKELAKSYMTLEEILKRVFAQKAAQYGYSEDLEKRCNEFGINRKNGTKATGQVMFKGANNSNIPLGALIKTNSGLQFKTTASSVIINETALVNIEAENIGSMYNIPAGTINILPVQITGVTEVKNIVPTAGGTDAEEDESLLERLLLRVQKPATSGNVNHYRQWAMDIPGVGDAKVFPLWKGPGTVKLVIIDSNKKPASDELITAVAKNIEKERPICVEVAVEKAVGKEFSVNAKVSLINGTNLNDVRIAFMQKLEEYRRDIAFKQNYISYGKIGSILLSVPGVLDYPELTVNDDSKNISLNDTEVPLINNINLSI